MQHLKFIIIAVLLTFLSCKEQGEIKNQKARITNKEIPITDSISADTSIVNYIKPYANRIDEEMSSVLAYASNDLDKSDGKLNTAIGNMMADAVMELSNPVFKKRQNQSIDAVLLNYGGIRSTIPKGNVTTRTAYNIMPFENSVYILRLGTKEMREMFGYLAKHKTAHPISGMQITLDKNGKLKETFVQGKPLQKNKKYWIATNNYLYRGGDNMVFLGKADKSEDLNYKLRNVFIDYFKKHDTINPQRDQRFSQEK